MIVSFHTGFCLDLNRPRLLIFFTVQHDSSIKNKKRIFLLYILVRIFIFWTSVIVVERWNIVSSTNCTIYSIFLYNNDYNERNLRQWKSVESSRVQYFPYRAILYTSYTHFLDKFLVLQICFSKFRTLHFGKTTNVFIILPRWFCKFYALLKWQLQFIFKDKTVVYC